MKLKPLHASPAPSPDLLPTEFKQPANSSCSPRERSSYSRAPGSRASNHAVTDHTLRSKTHQAPQLKVWEGRYGFDKDGFPYTTQAYRVLRKFGGAARLAFALKEIGEPIPAATIQGWLTPRSIRTVRVGVIPTPALYSVLRAAQADGVLLTPEDLDPRLLPVRDYTAAITESWTTDARDWLKEKQYGNPIIGGPLDSLVNIPETRLNIAREKFKVHPEQRLKPEPSVGKKK